MVDPRLTYAEITALGAEGGYSGLAVLANNSAVLMLSACDLLRREWVWFTKTHPYDEDEYDDICALISQLESDIMTSTVGTVLSWAASDLPSWGLLCDGAAYLKVDYPELWAAGGSVWEKDDDEFYVPDLVDRHVKGVSEGVPMAAKGGADEVTIGISSMPPHTHNYWLPGFTVLPTGGPYPGPVLGAPWTQPATTSTGDGDSLPTISKHQRLDFVIVSGRYTDHGA